MTTKEKYEELITAFARLGYELRWEPNYENPFCLVKLEPKRVVCWRTRATHVLYGILRTLEHEKGAR